MDEVRVLVFLLAFLAYTLFCTERGVRSAFAPLTVVGASVVWVAAFGIAGALRFAGWAWYIGALFALGWLVFSWGVKRKALPGFGPGFWLFLAATGVMTALLWARQPEFVTWDEFSFWGTAAKLTVLNDTLYPAVQAGWWWPASQPPTMVGFGYLAQFWGEGFHAWQVYLAADVLQFAAIAALLGAFEKRWDIAFPIGLTGLLAPYIFTHYAPPVKVSAVYLDSLGDVPMGLLFAAALAILLTGRGKRRKADVVALAACLAALCLVREPGLPLALVATGFAFFDRLLDTGAGPFKKRLGRGAVLAAGLAVLAGGLYLVWQRYIGGIATALGVGSTEATSLESIPAQILGDLADPGRNPLFRTVVQGMVDMFLKSRTTLLGSGLMVMAATLAIALFAAVTSREKALRRRAAVYSVVMLLGFLAYNVLIAATFIYLQVDGGLPSYERYMYPYYIGFFMGAVVLLGQAAKRSRWFVEGRVAVGLLAALCLFRVGQVIPVAYTAVGFSAGEYEDQRRSLAGVAAVAEGLSVEDDRIFTVSAGDDGSRWFQLHYEFLPYRVDYSFGGTFVDDRQLEGVVVGTEIDATAWRAYMAAEGVTVVYVDEVDEAFRDGYGEVFSDDLAAWDAGLTRLYRVVEGNGTVLLEPLLEEE